MVDLTDLVGEFDDEDGIVHLTARSPIRCQTREDGYALAEAVKNILKRHLSNRRGYMITDYTRIILEPKYIDEYAAVIREIMDTYLVPGGLARYGFDISRVTAQVGHEVYLKSPANLFNTREEAFGYIRRLAAQIRKEAENRPIESSEMEISGEETPTSTIGLDRRSQ
jgi:hypothetical protein